MSGASDTAFVIDDDFEKDLRGFLAFTSSAKFSELLDVASRHPMRIDDIKNWMSSDDVFMGALLASTQFTDAINAGIARVRATRPGVEELITTARASAQKLNLAIPDLTSVFEGVTPENAKERSDRSPLNLTLHAPVGFEWHSSWKVTKAARLSPRISFAVIGEPERTALFTGTWQWRDALWVSACFVQAVKEDLNNYINVMQAGPNDVERVFGSKERARLKKIVDEIDSITGALAALSSESSEELPESASSEGPST